MANELRIILKIAGREYPLTINRADEEKYRRAAKEINELVTMYSKRYSADMENYLAMVALQMALMNVQREMNPDIAPIIEELKRLESDLL